MWYFDEETLLFTHFQLVKRFGGSHGVRDIERVRSVIDAHKQHVFGVEQYDNVYEKAATYARNIIGDHPFIDGNKRTGITCALMFLGQNGITLNLEQKQLQDFAVKIATDQLDIPTIAEWLRNHTK